MIGKTFSHYKILEKLGEGGMGIVYKAQDTRLDRLVALKFLPEHLTSDLSAKARFIQEAKGASAINHPNIVTVHDIGEADGKSFIAMECLEGKSLKELAKENLKLNQVLEIGIQIAEGLAAAHKKEIWHRDIKSDNIMLTNDNVVKIMDFGLAKLKNSSKLTEAAATVGTVAYMSPEQTRGEAIDQRSDIFSLGVVLYELLTGRLPFQGEHNAAISYSICYDNPEPLARFKSDIPEELQKLVDKTLKKDRDMRYQSAADLAADLKRGKAELQEGRGEPAKTDKKSIAVLPFDNISPDPENEYFSDGLTEEIITNLSKIRDLKVISRTSIMRYKKTAKPLRQVAGELGVQHILEGSVRKHGNDLRITAQLVDAFEDAHLWAEKYRGTVEDVFDIQEKVAGEIVEALKLRLSPQEQKDLGKRYTEDLEAYRLYLLGRFHWNKLSKEGLKKGVEYFNQAIEKDPNYALAYVGLSECYGLFAPGPGLLPPKEAYSKAEAAAKRALEIDDSLAEAYNALAGKKLSYDWDFTEAEKDFKRALELKPNYAFAHQLYSEYLIASGRLEEAILEVRRAEELDPLSLMISMWVGATFNYARQYDRAIEQSKKTLAMDPNYARAYGVLSGAYRHKGMYAEAVAAGIKQSELSGTDAAEIAELREAFERAGWRGYLLKQVEFLKEKSKQEYVWPASFAYIYARLGEKDSAFYWLQKMVEERSEVLLFLKVSSNWDSLRADPRFAELVKKVESEKR